MSKSSHRIFAVSLLLLDAIASLRDDWRRHRLTLVALIASSSAVILLMSLGAGLGAFLDFEVEKTGDRWTSLSGHYSTRRVPGLPLGRRIEFTRRDLEQVGNLASVRTAAAEMQLPSVPVKSRRRTRGTCVSAASATLATIRNHVVARGRYFASGEERAGRRVAVIGAALQEIFFGDEDPLGATLQIEGEPFEVVGVLERKGFQFILGYDLHDRMIFIPLGAGQRLFGTGKDVGQIYLEPERLEQIPEMREEARRTILELHHLPVDDTDAIFIQSIPDTVRPLRKVAAGLFVVLGAIGTMTLTIAGIGVANMMVAMVRTRRNEFALRRACGASRRDITVLVLVETGIVVLSGGLVGLLSGVALVLLMDLAPVPEYLPRPLLSPTGIATTVGFLALLGLAAGLTPARLAGRVDPGLALRAL